LYTQERPSKWELVHHVSKPFSIRPKLFDSLKGYNAQTFARDLVAGLTVGLVALPLAMAFAISSGVKPEAGLYCAVVAGFLISALGGSKVQIGGPTGAFVVVVAGIVAAHGIDGLFMCTMMAGVLLLILGLTGLGSAIRYIPRPVVIGFTNGIAVLIASTQIKDLLGLPVAKVPSEFAPRMMVLGENLSNISPTAATLSLGSLVVIFALRKWAPRVPGPIIVLVASTLISFFGHLALETIQTRFGGIPAGLPPLRMPTFRPELIQSLLAPAFTVAMLGAIESLLSAVVGDRMAGDKHRPNTELVAQGIANIVSPLFGGLPATGAIARTATNIRSGAQTPVAGIIHALTLLMVLLFAAPLARHIPLAVLSAILIYVAYNMGEWAEIGAIFRQTKADIAVWAITFALTVFADLTVAVEAGMILAALLYIRRVTLTTTVARVTPEYIQEGIAHSLQLQDIPPGAAVYRIHGPFMFGSTEKLDIISREMEELPPVVIIRLRNMTAIDGTGVHALEETGLKLKESGRTLILCGLRRQPAEVIAKSHLARVIGQENIVADVASAIERARAVLASGP
jgi:SulP family sulfate permease